MIEIGLILISLLIGIVFLVYWIPKILGYPKIGKYSAVIVTLIIIIITCFTIFEDDLFSKNDAQSLLAEQSIQIEDDFSIEKNESMYSPGDYYHTFTLNITSKDRQRIIGEIKSSSNFNKEKVVEYYSENRIDYYTESKRIKNYETKDQYIRELFEPRGNGYAPIWRKIRIEKKDNKLIFEDIDE